MQWAPATANFTHDHPPAVTSPASIGAHPRKWHRLAASMMHDGEGRDLGFAMERGERQRRVAAIHHEYRLQRLQRRRRGYQRGIAVCDVVIAALCVGAAASIASAAWSIAHAV